MKLALPKPSGGYDPGNEAQARALIELADGQNIKRQDVLTALKFRDTATGQVVTLSVANGMIDGAAVQENVGAWALSDVSGAGLVFTSIVAGYTRIGNICFVYAQFAIPTNSNGLQVTIGGLPFAVANSRYAFGAWPIQTTASLGYAAGFQAMPGTSTLSLLNLTGPSSSVANSAMSGKEIWFAAYPLS